jgi:hypothetical protein
MGFYKITDLGSTTISSEQPTATGFSVSTTISLPNGGLTTSPVANSVTELLAASANNREYLITNTGSMTIKLFFGGAAATWESSNLMTPFILYPGVGWLSSPFTSKLSVYGWCDGSEDQATDGSIAIGVFT